MMYDCDDHDLFITPRVCFFSAAQGGASRHMMVNGTQHRQGQNEPTGIDLLYLSAEGAILPHVLKYGMPKSAHLPVLAVKIKCSNNELFRVSPVYCMLEPGKTQRLQIVRDPGTAKIDKIVLLYKPTTVQNARDAYAGDEDGELGAEKKLIALVAKEDVYVQSAPSTNLKSILKQSYQPSYSNRT